VEALRATGRPDLIEVANWLDNAEKAAVKAVLKFIGDSLKREGRISDGAASAIVNVKTEYIQSQQSLPPSTPEKSTTPLLDEYLSLLSNIADIASWRSALFLQGFIHSEDCSSLWLFDLKRDSESFAIRDLYPGPPSILIPGGTMIYLFDKTEDPEFRSLNSEIGESNNELPKRLSIEHRDEVVEICEDYINVKMWKSHEERGRRENVQIKYESTQEERIIDKKWAGIRKLITSFPVAVEERATALGDLRSLTHGK